MGGWGGVRRVCMFSLTTHNGAHRFKAFDPGESFRRWGSDLVVKPAPVEDKPFLGEDIEASRTRLGYT